VKKDSAEFVISILEKEIQKAVTSKNNYAMECLQEVICLLEENSK